MRHNHELAGIAGILQSHSLVHRTGSHDLLHPALWYRYMNHRLQSHENSDHVMLLLPDASDLAGEVYKQ